LSEIAINIRHLRVLLNKSKSTINGALLKMRYLPVPLNSEEGNRLMEVIPQLKDRYFSLRLWSVRRLSRDDSKAVSPPIPPRQPPPSSDPAEKSVFDYFPEIEFEFYNDAKSRIDRMHVLFGGIFLVTLLVALSILRPLLSRWYHTNRRQLPKLLRSVIGPGEGLDVLIAERRIEGGMPGEERRVKRGSKPCCLRRLKEWLGKTLKPLKTPAESFPLPWFPRKSDKVNSS
jgi:hypothetical protein